MVDSLSMSNTTANLLNISLRANFEGEKSHTIQSSGLERRRVYFLRNDYIASVLSFPTTLRFNFRDAMMKE